MVSFTWDTLYTCTCTYVQSIYGENSLATLRWLAEAGGRREVAEEEHEENPEARSMPKST